MDKLSDDLKQPLVDFLLAVADDKFFLGHHNTDWTGLGPILEEDIAFSSIAQDEIAHANELYEMAGGLIGKKADQLAFGRQANEYRCARVVESNDDWNWANAVVRQFFCDHFDHLRLGRMALSSYKPLADLAKRLVAEEKVHIDHVDAWIRRLGKGTEDSKKRIQEAIDRLAPLASSLAEPSPDQDKLEAAGVYPAGDIFGEWSRSLTAIAAAADLKLQLAPPADEKAGRHGNHADGFETVWEEFTEVARVEPDAEW